jgi:hypothetical protein
MAYIDQMAPIAMPSKNYPTMDFWFENTPSGNPALTSVPEKVGRYN